MKLAILISLALAVVGSTVPLRSPKSEKPARHLRLVEFPPMPPTNSVIRKSRMTARVAHAITTPPANRVALSWHNETNAGTTFMLRTIRRSTNLVGPWEIAARVPWAINFVVLTNQPMGAYYTTFSWSN